MGKLEGKKKTIDISTKIETISQTETDIGQHAEQDSSNIGKIESLNLESADQAVAASVKNEIQTAYTNEIGEKVEKPVAETENTGKENISEIMDEKGEVDSAKSGYDNISSTSEVGRDAADKGSEKMAESSEEFQQIANDIQNLLDGMNDDLNDFLENFSDDF